MMTLRLPINDTKYVYLISIYAPTLTANDDDKAEFYRDLSCVLTAIPPQDKIVLLGDFNARVGTDYEAWPGILGRHGVGNCNANGLELLTLCAEFDLCLTNTFFRLPGKYKTSWMHPRSRHWHLLDYVIVRKRDRNDVLITRAMRGAECWSDHRLIRSKMRLKLKPPRRAAHKKPVNACVAPLVHSEKLRRDLDNHFGTNMEDVTDNVDEAWHSYAKSLRDSVSCTIPKPQKRNQDWFDYSDEEIRALLENHRLELRTLSNTDRRRSIQRELKIKIRDLKNQWWLDRSKDLQLFADTNQTGRFFEGLKEIFGPKSRKTAPIYSRDRDCRLTDHKQILDRWAEHFNDVLNPCSQTTDLSYVEDIDCRPVKEDLADPPTFDEFMSAVKRLKNAKTPGTDCLPSEVYKYGGPHIQSRLFNLVLKVWETEVVPQDWKDASICKLYKGKGELSDCGSYRGISLLSSAGKVLAHIINRRLANLAEQILPESQCGFRPGRGTVDGIFIVKQFQEKSLEQNRPLYMCFVDLEKAFDRVPRAALWVVLKKAGCPEKFVNMIRQFHDGMTARVEHENDFSDPIHVTSGVKQGCVMAPTLFALYFSAVLNDALKHSVGQIELNVRTDKSVFDISRFRARTKTSKVPVLDVLYADDVCLLADCMETLQVYVNDLQASCCKFGLVISVKKTQILKQPPRGCDADSSTVKLHSEPLEEVSRFKYLGSQVCNDNRLAFEIPARIAKAAATFGKLGRRVWTSHDLKLQTKISVYKALVLPILTYAAETWCLYRGDIKRLDTFHLRCLRSILRIKWQDRVPNSEVLRRTGMMGIEAILIRIQLRWCGHMQRMDTSRLPKTAFYSELTQGKRAQGGQYLRYKDVLKRHLTSCGIPVDRWQELAKNRERWRTSIHKATECFETNRLEDLDIKRQLRKSRPKPSYAYTTNDADQLFCIRCDRVFKTKFGFASHQRAHERKEK